MEKENSPKTGRNEQADNGFRSRNGMIRKGQSRKGGSYKKYEAAMM